MSRRASFLVSPSFERHPHMKAEFTRDLGWNNEYWGDSDPIPSLAPKRPRVRWSAFVLVELLVPVVLTWIWRAF